MATAFGVDLDAARSLAQDLRSVRTDLAAMHEVASGAASVTGSAKVAAALEGFVARSGDQRAALLALLDRATGLLDALVDGTEQVDGTLASALPEVAAAGARRVGGLIEQAVRP